jgi:biotin carboxyl carrier protein
MRTAHIFFHAVDYMSRTVRASTVRFKSIPHPYILIVITHTRATNGAITAAQDLVNDLKATNYNSGHVLILTATHRAVRQLEQPAAIEGVNMNNNSLPSGGPVALLYTRGPGGNMKREILQGANRIKNAFGKLSWRLSNSTPPSQFGTPGSSVATSPVQVPSSRPSQRGSPSKQSSVPPTVARSPSQAAATPRSTSQSPGSGNGINYANTIVNTNNSNQERARALYDVFRKVLNNNTNKTRLVAVTLVENGDHVTSDDFTHHLEVMKRELKNKMGTFARLPPSGSRVLTPNTVNGINRVLAPAYAKARGRAFVVILVYAQPGDPPKGKYSQKVIERVIECYTPAALIRHVIQPGVTAALLGQ